MPKISCILGLRMSASISRTFCPTSAIAMPRLLTTVDLPSPGPELVNTNTFGRLPFSPANRMEIRADLKDSASIEGLRCQVTSSTRSSKEDVDDNGTGVEMSLDAARKVRAVRRILGSAWLGGVFSVSGGFVEDGVFPGFLSLPAVPPPISFN